MDGIKIEYIYLAAIIAAFVAVLIIGFFLQIYQRHNLLSSVSAPHSRILSPLKSAYTIPQIPIHPELADICEIYGERIRECGADTDDRRLWR